MDRTQSTGASGMNANKGKIQGGDIGGSDGGMDMSGQTGGMMSGGMGQQATGMNQQMGGMNQQMTGGAKTGASNLEYDLIAEMHEILEGNAALEKYIQDACACGDTEVEQCFKRIHDQNRQHVSALRELLARRLAA